MEIRGSPLVMTGHMNLTCCCMTHEIVCKHFAFPSACRHKPVKKQPCENIIVAYYFCGEPIPYRTSVKGRIVTLGQFKELLTKKGSYR